MPTIRDDVPNLRPGEVAFALDSGELATVCIEQLPPKDGQFTVITVSGRLIDANGKDALTSTVFHPEPHPVRLPESNHTVYHAAIASGDATLSETIARVSADALEHWKRFLLGMAVVQRIPVRQENSNA